MDNRHILVWIHRHILDNPSEGCFSDVRRPKIPKMSPQMFSAKIVHTSGTFFEFVFEKMSKILLNHVTISSPIQRIRIRYSKLQFFTKTPKNKNTFKIQKSKSTAYPSKQTRTDVSGQASGAVFRCASFIRNMLFFDFHNLYIFIYIYIYVFIF